MQCNPYPPTHTQRESHYIIYILCSETSTLFNQYMGIIWRKEEVKFRESTNRNSPRSGWIFKRVINGKEDRWLKPPNIIPHTHELVQSSIDLAFSIFSLVLFLPVFIQLRKIMYISKRSDVNPPQQRQMHTSDSWQNAANNFFYSNACATEPIL